MIENMSVDELLELRSEINLLLHGKGYQVYFDIERGAKGAEVGSIQARLQELGFYNGLESGKYDTETIVAFKMFEKANGLKNDGIASAIDQAVLFGKDAVYYEKKQQIDKEPIDNDDAKGKNIPGFELQIETSWAANIGLNGFKLFTPHLRILVTNHRGSDANNIVLNIVFYNEFAKEVWDDETYYLVSPSDAALKDGYSKAAYVKSSVGYTTKINESRLPTITAEISINGQLYETVVVDNIYR